MRHYIVYHFCDDCYKNWINNLMLYHSHVCADNENIYCIHYLREKMSSNISDSEEEDIK
jgi:hypothetical protein